MGDQELAKSERRVPTLKSIAAGIDAEPVSPTGQEDYSRLLMLLDPDPKAADEKYLILREKLILLFDRRGCPDSDLQADEVLSRIARKVSSESIEDIGKYAVGVARLRFQEILRERKHGPVQSDRLDQVASENGRWEIQAEPHEELIANEIRLECLEACMKQLPENDQELLKDYYREQRRKKIDLRQGLAEKYGMSIGALRTHLCRVRQQLAGCCRECISRPSLAKLKQP